MRIGVDAHYATGLYQGILTYLRELYGAVAALPHGHEIVFFLPDDCPSDIVDDWSALGSVAQVSRGNRLARQLAGLGTAARRAGIDVLHAQTVAPLRVPCKTMVTIHDLLCLTHPEFFGSAFRLQLAWALRRTVKRADLLLPVSEHTQDALWKLFDSADKVCLVPNGVDHTRFTPHGRSEAKVRLANRYGLEKSFVLTVGRMDVRKNHLALIEAYRQATAAIERSHAAFETPDLIIVGQPAYGSDRVLEAGDALIREGRLKIFPDVPTADLPDFYKACTVFAFPSLAEGFGIPPLEAMACGAPVVACNTTAVAEVVGQAGVLVDPQCPKELVDALSRMLTDAGVRESYSNAGVVRAAEFSWRRSAAHFLEALDRLQKMGRA
jgi:glycosyltransferase involved in cell wall biosynthesis